MPRKRIFPALLVGSWWILLVLLAWNWASGLVNPAIESFTCVFQYPLPPAGQITRQLGAVGGGIISFFLALGALAGMGKAALDWVDSPPFSPLEGLATRALAGIGLFCMIVFALGLSGLLYQSVTFTLGGLALFSALLHHRSLHPRLALTPTVPTVSPLAIVVALALAVLFVFSLAPETTVDALEYHLAAPAHYRSIHRIAVAPHMMYRNPLLTEHLLAAFPGFAPLLAYRWMGLALLVMLMAGWTNRCFGRTTALVAVLCLLSSQANATLATVVKPDLYASAFVLLGVLAWERATAGWGKQGRQAVLCGAVLGLAFCTKMTTAAAIAGIIGWHLLFPRSFPVRRVMLAVVGFLAVAGPFLVRTWIVSGNPVYPLWFGGLGWSDTSEPLMINGWPQPNIDPNRLDTTMASLGRFLSSEALPALFGLSLLAVFNGLRQSTAGVRSGQLLLWCVIFVAAQIWVFQAPYMRFTMPILPVLYGIGAAGITGLVRRASLPGTVILAGLLLLPGFIRVVALANMAGPRMKLNLPVAIGLEKREGFLARNLTGYWRAANQVKTIAASPGRLLLVADARGYLLSKERVTISRDFPDFPFILKSARETFDPDGIRKRFRQKKISLIGLNYLSSSRIGLFYSRLDRYWTMPELRRWYAFFSRYGEQVGNPDKWDYDNGGWVFYRINSRPSRSPSFMTYLPGTGGLVWIMPGETPERHRTRLRLLTSIAPTVEFFQVHRDGAYRQ
jgi:hypothetical protein